MFFLLLNICTFGSSFVASVYFSGLFQMETTHKGKNLLMREKILFFKRSFQ